MTSLANARRWLRPKQNHPGHLGTWGGRLWAWRGGRTACNQVVEYGSAVALGRDCIGVLPPTQSAPAQDRGEATSWRTGTQPGPDKIY